MKSKFLPLLLTLGLLCAVTGCGRDNTVPDNNGTGNGVVNDNTVQGEDPILGGNADNGVNNGTANGNGTTNGNMADNGTVNGNDTVNGNGTVNGGLNNDGTGPNSTTANGTANNGAGATGRSVIRPTGYDQMLRNARVHDTDGILTDGENAVTPGIIH